MRANRHLMGNGWVWRAGGRRSLTTRLPPALSSWSSGLECHTRRASDCGLAPRPQPLARCASGYGHYHHLLRINENFGRIDLNMPIHVVLDIPPEVEGGVQLPKRLDQWGAESAPAYRALLGLSFLWHEPGRTHAPIKGGRWVRRTGLDPYDPLEDDDVIALAFPNTRVRNKSVVIGNDIHN